VVGAAGLYTCGKMLQHCTNLPALLSSSIVCHGLQKVTLTNPGFEEEFTLIYILDTMGEIRYLMNDRWGEEDQGRAQSHS